MQGEFEKVRVKRISSNGGFLRNVSINFENGLCCIIGARGTCKSTIIESIGFVLDTDKERVRALTARDRRGPKDPPYHGMVAATLGNASFECEIEVCHEGEAINYRIEREVGSATRLFRDGIRELTDTSILNCVELYSQSDLQALAEDDEQRLRLIDKANSRQIRELQENRGKLLGHLKGVGLDIRQKRSVILTLETQLREAPAIRQQLDVLRANRPTISAALDAARQRYLARSAAERDFRSAIEAIQALDLPIEETERVRDRINGAVGELAKAEGAEGLINALTPMTAALSTALEALLTVARNDTQLALEHYLNTTLEIESTYRALQREEQIVNDALRQEDQLLKQFEHMQRLRAELDTENDAVNLLLARRRDLRSKVSELESGIFELRMSQVDLINTDASGEIFVRLEPGAQAEPYLERLSDLLSGSRIQNQRGVAEEIAGVFSASELIDLVEAGNAKELAGALRRDLGQMTRVVTHLADHEELYSLETEVAEDRLQITMIVDGFAKPIEALSKGQKATALLPLVLRSSPYPLLMDQPEDDLDNRFVYNFLVQNIRQLKESRQIIFVTHNANIPVLGDADQIVVMQMETPETASEPLIGSVDERKTEILELLEGGRRAFELRQEKYQDLLA